MAFSRFSLLTLFFLVSYGTSTFLSDDSHGFIGRKILQETMNCPIDMKNLPYQMIRDKCKASAPKQEECCPPYKQVLCSVSSYTENTSYNCREQFFSYLNSNIYPGGFFTICDDNKYGFDCPVSSPPPLGNGGQEKQILLVSLFPLVLLLAWM